MDWSVVNEYAPQFVEAGVLTLRLAAWGIVFALVVGLIFAAIKYFKVPVLSQIIACYVEFARNTPLIIQLFFIYYGLPKLGVVLPGDVCAITGLAFLGGAYMEESFRAGFIAVKVQQIEAARALGMAPLQVFRWVVLPLSFQSSVTSVLANIVFLLKETSVFSAIGVMDLMFKAKSLIGLRYDTYEVLFLLVLSYLVILVPVVIIYYIVQQRLRRARAV
jgi:polar amino acid transport system permease protein